MSISKYIVFASLPFAAAVNTKALGYETFKRMGSTVAGAVIGAAGSSLAAGAGALSGAAGAAGSVLAAGSSALAAGGSALAAGGAALGAVAAPVALAGAAGYGVYRGVKYLRGSGDKLEVTRDYNADVKNHLVPVPAMARSDQMTILSREIKSDEAYLRFLLNQYPQDTASMAITRRDLDHSRALEKVIRQHPAPDESLARNKAIEFVEDMTSV